MGNWDSLEVRKQPAVSRGVWLVSMWSVFVLGLGVAPLGPGHLGSGGQYPDRVEHWDDPLDWGEGEGQPPCLRIGGMSASRLPKWGVFSTFRLLTETPSYRLSLNALIKIP